MVSNLPDEKKLPLSKVASFRGFQTMPAPPGTEMQQDAGGCTSAAIKKEPEWQMKEVGQGLLTGQGPTTISQCLPMISTFYEYKLIQRQQVLPFQDISHLKTSLQELKTWLEEKEKDLIKEKNKISEEKGLVMQQDKILEDMQIKISHLEEQLKHPELTGLPQGKEVESCPCSLTPKESMVKLIQKSMTSYLRKISLCFGISVWLLDKLLVHTGCLWVTLALLLEHVSNPTWVDWILKGIFHQHNRSYLQPH